MRYECPSCGGALEPGREALVCGSCGAYPDRGGFYDFLGEGNPTAMVSLFDAVSSVYETPVWYPLGTRVATGGGTSVDAVVEEVASGIGGDSVEEVVDVACGTGLFGRRIARDADVHGVDASREMLRRAVHNARSEGVILELARADAAGLPYSDDSFDAAVCCGALHILPEPRETVREMGRVVRQDGSLAVTTVVEDGIFSSRVARMAADLYGVTVFEDAEIDGILDDAGFDRVETKRHSSLVTVTARRR